MLRWILAFFVIVLLLMLLDNIWCMTRFRTTCFTLQNGLVRKPCRLLMLSDLHDRTYGKDNEKLIQAIDRANPDVILMAGDMITSTTECDYSVALSLCQKLATRYPVYYALGNHEQKWKERPVKYDNVYQEYLQELKRCGVIVLDNDQVALPEFGITVYGLSIERNEYYKRFSSTHMEKLQLDEKLGKPDEEHYRILLAHNPDYFTTYSEWGANLTLSGHVHGGIVQIPFLGGVIAPSLRLFPKYDAGLFEDGENKMILGRGLGYHTLPVRIGNPAELICIDLHSAE